jgi:hypothetical protein
MTVKNDILSVFSTENEKIRSPGFYVIQALRRVDQGVTSP